MTYHIMCVHIIFSSVLVAEWPFGKQLLTRLTCILTSCNCFSFCFEDWIWILIASFPLIFVCFLLLQWENVVTTLSSAINFWTDFLLSCR